MVAIETRYHGPSTVHGSRVSCRRMDDAKRPETLYFGWQHALDSEGNHRAAALAWLAKRGWLDEYGDWIGGNSKRGMVFVNAGRHGGEILHRGKRP